MKKLILLLTILISMTICTDIAYSGSGAITNIVRPSTDVGIGDITYPITKTVTLGLDVKSLSEQIVLNNEFDVIVYADFINPSIKLYEIGINFDNEYFELKDVSGDESSGDITSKTINNESGIVDFTCNVGGKSLVENIDGNCIIAILTFKTLKDVDKTLTFEIDEERTALFDGNGNIKSNHIENLEIEVPETPYKSAPRSNLFYFGDILWLSTKTKDAQIYYTTSEAKEPSTKYNDSIILPKKSITYYVVAKKYGISSEKIKIQLTYIDDNVIYFDKYGNLIPIQNFNMIITDESGSVLSNLQNGDDIIINIRTRIFLEYIPYVFVAVYDSDGHMKDIYSSAYTSEIEFATEYYVGGYVKFFVVSDYTGLIPIHLTKVPLV